MWWFLAPAGAQEMLILVSSFVCSCSSSSNQWAIREHSESGQRAIREHSEHQIRVNTVRAIKYCVLFQIAQRNPKYFSFGASNSGIAQKKFCSTFFNDNRHTI